MTVSASFRINLNKFNFSSGSHSNAIDYFRIDPVSGRIALIKFLDFEKSNHYSILVKASDGNVFPKMSLLQVDVTVADVNDNIPTFNQTAYSFSIFENESIGFIVHKFMVMDSDTISKNFTFQLQHFDNSGAKFQLNPARNDELILKTTIEPDGSSPDDISYTMVLECSDNGNPELTSTAKIHILVLSINDFTPTFTEGASHTISIPESQHLGEAVGTFLAIDEDFGLAGDLTYSKLEGTDPDGFFIVNPDSGKIFLAKYLDYENALNRSLSFIMRATDKDPVNPKSSELIVTINVGDVDDNDPVCNYNSITVSFNESVPENTLIVSPNLGCSDPDSMDNALAYSVLGNFHADVSVQNNTPGIIKFSNSPDFENISQYDLEIKVMSSGKHVTISLIIIILPLNDNDPFFESNITIVKSESIPIGEILTVFRAIDLDTGNDGVIFHQIHSVTNNGIDKFLINPITGEIKLKRDLDFEQTQNFSISVLARDNGSPMRSTTGYISLLITDENDNSPQCTVSSYVLKQDEAIPPSLLPLMLIKDLGCSDADSGIYGRLSFSVIEHSGSNIFVVNPGPLGGGILNLTSDLDYETKKQYSIKITVRDGGLKSTEVSVIISVNPVNEGGPVLSDLTITVRETDSINTIITKLDASDVDSSDHSHGALIYSIVDGDPEGKFFINSQTGIVRIAGLLDRETQPIYHLMVKVVEAAKLNSVNSTLTIVVANENDNIPNCTTAFFHIPVSESIIITSDNPYKLIDLNCSDSDHNNLTYSIISGNISKFQIDQTGSIYLKSAVDFDESPSLRKYKLLIKVSDFNYSTTVSGNIIVFPENERRPNFTSPFYKSYIKESYPAGSVIVRVEAIDMDSKDTDHGRVIYTFSNGSYNPFYIDEERGYIILASGNLK